MIPAPHGGRLVTSLLTPRASEQLHEELRDLPKLWPEPDQLLDAVQIGIGAYSPLDGFMDRDALDSVLFTSRLPNSLPWTIPILLTPPGSRNRQTIDRARPGDEIALLDAHNHPVARLHLRQSYPLERARIAREVYRTTDARHPDVGLLERTGDTVLAGPIDLVPRPDAEVGPLELTPTESRGLFSRRHWSAVAAFQTRNVPHRAHEHLQRLALDRDDVDGLFIHPVVGWPKPGDYRPAVVLRTYETLIENYLPVERVVLGSLPIRMRFAGPRAAIFLAIVRKNYGCSHYIVGRDQAGIAGHFDPFESQRVFDELPIGVVPLRFPEFSYCRRCDAIVSTRSCPHPAQDRVGMSQSRVRRALARGELPPPGLLRPEVADLLREIGSLFVGPEDEETSPTSNGKSPHRPRPVSSDHEEPPGVHEEPRSTGEEMPPVIPHPG
ncbi:MAG TPA: sulfate adenylyltransferase [Thermoplasmata archaeon]|nr:sulfate adenylyltransferase [Thermoplasmata archaeon]